MSYRDLCNHLGIQLDEYSTDYIVKNGTVKKPDEEKDKLAEEKRESAFSDYHYNKLTNHGCI